MIELSKDIVQILTPQQAWHYNIVPENHDNQSITFLVDENFDVQTKDELELFFGKNIQVEQTRKEDLRALLTKYYRTEKKNNNEEFKVDNDFLSSLIAEAKSLGSSDIHIEVYDEKCRIRIRIDGKLADRYNVPKMEYPTLINKIKIKANLDIAEKRLPQDGRIFFNESGMKFDIRVSVLPTLHGEKVVLRLLNNDATNISIERLGFKEEEQKIYLEGVRKPHGIILISGPTGSGKTTTLYATLKLLNKETTNIVTIEDPIEYTLEGINQVQLKESIGLNFGAAMRTFLRQDPDVIMVGEIRDPDTANMAIRASLTGHLVLSTIHTNSAWGSVSRLVDMGVPAYLVSNTLNMTIAQRLVRKLCEHCKKKEAFDPQLLPLRYAPPKKVTEHYTATGCEHCHYTGYSGRVAVYEVIPLDMELSDEIKKQNFDVNDRLKERGISTISDNAFDLFEKGISSIEEVYPLLINF